MPGRSFGRGLVVALADYIFLRYLLVRNVFQVYTVRWRTLERAWSFFPLESATSNKSIRSYGYSHFEGFSGWRASLIS
jgi:hypothetical protein